MQIFIGYLWCNVCCSSESCSTRVLLKYLILMIWNCSIINNTINTKILTLIEFNHPYKINWNNFIRNNSNSSIISSIKILLIKLAYSKQGFDDFYNNFHWKDVQSIQSLIHSHVISWIRILYYWITEIPSRW